MKKILAILSGMGITMRLFFRKAVTVQYPEKPSFTGKRWRGVHGLFFTENLNEELCVSCHLCARVCPAVCIEMEGHVDEEGVKRLNKFNVDLARCIYCGYCEEVCPVDAIRLTTSSDYTARNRDKLLLRKEDLLSVGQSAMKRGEDGVLGIRNGDGENLEYPIWLNRQAKFESADMDFRVPLGHLQVNLQHPDAHVPDPKAKVE